MLHLAWTHDNLKLPVPCSAIPIFCDLFSNGCWIICSAYEPKRSLTMRGHNSEIYDVASFSNSSYVISCSADKTSEFLQVYHLLVILCSVVMFLVYVLVT